MKSSKNSAFRHYQSECKNDRLLRHFRAFKKIAAVLSILGVASAFEENLLWHGIAAAVVGISCFVAIEEERLRRRADIADRFLDKF